VQHTIDDFIWLLQNRIRPILPFEPMRGDQAPLRPRLTCAARRRRAERLSDRRLSGTRRSRLRAQLDLGRVYRRHQLRDHRQPERRPQNLEAYRSTVSGRKIWAYTPEGDIFRDSRNQTSSLMTLLFGQPGYFQPRDQSLAANARLAERHKLLRLRRTKRHARTTYQFRSFE
jgi:hypothetical protein